MSEYLLNSFNSFDKMNVMIIGDVMIDAYLWGKVERISPEAPVPILSISKKEDRLGGAANVAMNIQSLGANPIMCSVIGEDSNAEKFCSILTELGITDEGIIKSKNRVTTVKTRAIGHHQHLIRIDEENDHVLNADEENQLLGKINSIIQTKKVDVIIFQDYDKGVLTETLIQAVTAIAKKENIKIVVDPKKRNFLSYNNLTLFKPNLKELKEGLKIEFNHVDQKQLVEAAKLLRNKINAEMVMITLSEHGVLILNNEEHFIIPAHIRNISDVSGAGDTVISVAALCLAADMSMKELASLANLSGGLVCEKIGVVPIDKNELLNEALMLDVV